ncbi:MAG: hypothetical protein LQ344_002038 [Seirophora lacunosa]|nr:MAG: hypothetical protein LQ344_002038 [Seirophora lacunosa]
MSYHSNTSYPYTTSYGYSYQGYPNPAEPQYASTTTSSYPSSSSYPSYSSAYVTSAAMIPNTSQDSHTSSSSANSRYSSNTYASSYGTSPSSPQSPLAFGHQQQQQQSSYPAPSSRSHYVPLASSQPIPPPTIKPSSSSDKNKKPTPFICLHAGCPRQFARSFDLDRHLKTHFPAAAPRLDCPKGLAGAWCGRVGDRGFTRQDHLNEHLRKVHLVDLPKSARGSRESRA